MMNLEDIMLSEISQSDKDKYSMISYVESNFKNVSHCGTESKMVVTRN